MKRIKKLGDAAILIARAIRQGVSELDRVMCLLQEQELVLEGLVAELDKLAMSEEEQQG